MAASSKPATTTTAAASAAPASTTTAQASTTTAQVWTDDLESILGNTSDAASTQAAAAETEADPDESAAEIDAGGAAATGEVDADLEEGAGDEAGAGDDAPADGETTTSEESADDQGDATTAAAEDPDTALDSEAQAARAKFTAEQQKLFDKAMGKKTKRIVDLRTQLQERESALTAAQAQLQQRAPASVAPTANDPFADVETEADLETRMRGWHELRQKALRNPKGFQLPNGDKEPIEIDEQRAAEIVAESEHILMQAAPQRRAFLQQRAQIEAQAATVYPWLKDKNSPQTMQVEALVRQWPQLRSVPGIRLFIADALQTLHARAKAAQAAQKPAATTAAAGGAGKPKAQAPKAPSTPAGKGNRAPIVPAGRVIKAKAHQRLAETGDDPDNAALSELIINGG